MPRKIPPSRCQQPKLTVAAIAADLRISPRTLARWAKAKEGIPGVKKGPGQYQFIGWNEPEARAWLADRKRFRKGNRKQPKVRKSRLSHAQLFARLISRIEKQVTVQLDAALQRSTRAGLDELTTAAERLRKISDQAVNRIRLAVNNPAMLEDF